MKYTQLISRLLESQPEKLRLFNRLHLYLRNRLASMPDTGSRGMWGPPVVLGPDRMLLISILIELSWQGS
ncbi:MAG: hypothetical protein HQ569_07765 [Actinobacteria bacterium]|nr:hypothetical protein [Actinomycetota bacterium]